MNFIDKVAKTIERLGLWLGFTDPTGDIAPDELLAPYRPVCTPRIGETYARYSRRARDSDERPLLLEVWKVSAEEDDGVWKTAHDGISRARDSYLDARNGWAS